MGGKRGILSNEVCMMQPEAGDALTLSRGVTYPTDNSIPAGNTKNTGPLNPCLPYVLQAITPNVFVLEEGNKGGQPARLCGDSRYRNPKIAV